MIPPKEFLCPACGLLTPGTMETRHEPILTLVITIGDHNCRPQLRRFFNPDAQHRAPFQR